MTSLPRSIPIALIAPPFILWGTSLLVQSTVPLQRTSTCDPPVTAQ